jgi:hypothetical protein
MEELDKSSVDIIDDDAIRSLQILSLHVDETHMSYLTKTRKMLSLGKTLFTVS